ncbi:MAG: putative peptidoglycan binding protein, partial [Actinomycetia bacterium]|nr:putative peptidoglycan binding protein [Actinomycetes bacterium]
PGVRGRDAGAQVSSRLTSLVAALAAGVSVIGGVAVVAHGDSGGGSRDLVITAEAQRRTLTDDVTLKGTVGRVEQRRVDAAAPGLVGEVHIDDGTTVEAGQALLSLDGRDAVAVPGDLPFFRNLDVGSRGHDVRQLEQVLAADGYQPGTVDDVYTEQTRFALAQWQAKHGYPGATPEHPETVAVALTQGAGYKVGAQSSTGVTIGASAKGAASDGRTPTASLVPVQGRPSFHLASSSNPLLTVRAVDAVTPEGGLASFEISADDTPSVNLDVKLSVSGTAGADDVVAPSTVTFPKDTWSIRVQIPVRQDDLVEDEETLVVALAAGSNYHVGTGTASTRVVSDDVPELNVVGGGRVVEGQPATITVIADQAPVRDTQVSLSVGGDATASRDYRTIDPVVTLAAGNTAVVVTLTTLVDDILENDERVVVAVSPGTGYRVGRAGAAVTTIASQPGAAGLPVVTLRPTATRVAEGQPFPLTVSLDHSLTEDLPITLTYGGTAVVGDDFTPVGGRFVVPAGQTSATLQVPTVQDARVEPDRVLSVALATSDRYRVGSPSSGAATVESDDLPELRLVGGGGTVGEGKGATLTVVADQAPSEDTSVSYQIVGTATPGQDFNALTGTVVLRAGQTRLTIPILTLADDVVFQATDMIAGHWPIRVGQVLVKEGAAVTAGTPLLSLTDAGLTVTLKASASDRTKLKTGQKVTVKLEGATDEVDGVISELDETATTDEQTKAQSYEGKVTIGDFAAADGASVTIDVVLDQRTDALAVPIAAVKQDGSGGDVVRVLDLSAGGKIREVPVKTGIAEGSYIEIRSGIKAGDVVIVEVDTKA